MSVRKDRVYLPQIFSAPPQGKDLRAGSQSLPDSCVWSGGCLSPLLRGWWPEVKIAPPVHVHVLVVQITFLLFAVVARVVPPVVWVGARVAIFFVPESPPPL